MNKGGKGNGTNKRPCKIIYVPVDAKPSDNDIQPGNGKRNKKKNKQNKNGNLNSKNNEAEQNENNNKKNGQIGRKRRQYNIYKKKENSIQPPKNSKKPSQSNSNVKTNQQLNKKYRNKTSQSSSVAVPKKKKEAKSKLKNGVETKKNEKQRTNKKTDKKRERKKIFESYQDISKVLEKVADGEYKFGTINSLSHIKITAKVKNMNKPVFLLDKDFNRAINGDKVVIQIYDESKWMTMKQINEYIKELRRKRRKNDEKKDDDEEKSTKNNESSQQESKDQDKTSPDDHPIETNDQGSTSPDENKVEIDNDQDITSDDHIAEADDQESTSPDENDDDQDIVSDDHPVENDDDQDITSDDYPNESNEPNVLFVDDEITAVDEKDSLLDMDNEDSPDHNNEIDEEDDNQENEDVEGDDIEDIPIIDEIPEINEDEENIIDDDYDDNELYPTGKVVYVCPRTSNDLLFAGRISSKGYFIPFNDKIPIFFVRNRRDYASKDIDKHVFTVEYIEWDEYNIAPAGRIVKCIEMKDDIDTQFEILLSEYRIDQVEYSEMLVKHFPKEVNITEEDLKDRLDLRDKIVISIDPPTARDLDDAVSIEKMDNGHFQVGVHIADVTHYVKPNDEIDKIARSRCITFYFIHKVIPMLPEILSSHLCSLLGGKDRLSFSVMWEMDSEGNIYDTWIGKTIVHSCAKLSYDDATMILDSTDDIDKCREILKEKIEKTDNEDELIRKIIDSLVSINKITENLRKKRFEKGVLNVRSFRLQFEFEQEDYHQIKSFHLQQQTKSSYIIEELMIQANISVATKIKKAFPNASLLRYHPPPKESELMKLEKFFTKRGQVFDGSSVESLLKTINSYNEIERMAFDVLFLDALNPSLYYCTNEKRNELETRHYGLNIDLYTHFTSPIRRYADIIVHRILDHTLKLEKENNLENYKEIIGNDEIESICEALNKQARVSRTSALRCEDIFLYRWILDQKEKVIDDKCFVLKIRGKSKELIAFSTLLMRNVHIPLPEKYYKVDEKKYEVKGKNGKESIYLQYLSQIRVELGVENKGNRKKFIGKLYMDSEEEGEVKVDEKRVEVEVKA